MTPEQRKRRNKSRPLRRVIDYAYEQISPGSDVRARWEVLECGHRLLPRRDIAGETSANAERRRCWRCGARSDGGGTT